MNLFLIIVLVAILLETTYLTIRASFKNLPTTNQKRKSYIDTSALMDGRILEVAKTGFIADDLIIPRSVIRELQLLADGKDAEKRTRARFGMDVANDLERVEYCNVTILQDALDRTPVDERLLQLAKDNHGTIITTDFNLGKVASTEHIDVLNVNDLAMVLRSEYLPGDKFTIKITAEGSNPKQGVGHLLDGTMVVVDEASNKIGQELEIEAVRYLQTAAGRMMFAKQTHKGTTKKSSRSKQYSQPRR